MKYKADQYLTVGTVPKSNGKIVTRGEFDSPSTQIHHRSPSCLGASTVISDAVKLAIYPKSPLLLKRYKCLLQIILKTVQFKHCSL